VRIDLHHIEERHRGHLSSPQIHPWHHPGSSWRPVLPTCEGEDVRRSPCWADGSKSNRSHDFHRRRGLGEGAPLVGGGRHPELVQIWPPPPMAPVRHHHPSATFASRSSWY
jgi:hypothetical protein